MCGERISPGKQSNSCRVSCAFRARIPFVFGEIIPVLLIFCLFLILHFLTVNWDLPASAEHAPDCIPVLAPGDVQNTLAANTYKYPPLQYLFVCRADSPRAEASAAEIRDWKTEQILRFRSATGAMELGILLLIYAMGRFVFRLPRGASFFASASFALLPLTLFYSATSNMDIPYVFWFMASVLSAVLAELYCAGRKKTYAVLGLLTGILIGCAFCTKDQVYSLYILPSFYLIWLRRKKCGTLWTAFLPFFLWGAGFLCCTLSVYLFSGGWTTAVRHFHWITTSGKNDFFQFAPTFAGRFGILFAQLQDFVRTADGPLLLFCAASLFALSRTKKFTELIRTRKIFLIAFFLLILSSQLFLHQVLRASYPRFQLPYLPFLCLLAWMAWLKTPQKFRWISALLFFICLLFPAGQTVWNMRNTPVSRAKKLILEENLPEQFRIATMRATSERTYVYSGSEVRSLHMIRSWAAGRFDFTPRFFPDLPADRFSLAWSAPDILILSEDGFPEMLLKDKSYFTGMSFPAVKSVPSLWQPDFPCVYILQRNPDILFQEDADFAKMNLSEQLMRVGYLLTQVVPTGAQIRMIGERLRPFEALHYEGYEISEAALAAALYGYFAAGRGEDYQKLAAFVREHFVQGAKLVDTIASELGTGTK